MIVLFLTEPHCVTHGQTNGRAIYKVECIIMQVIKSALISARNAPKAFRGRARPGPPGGTYSAPQTS